MTRCRRVDDDAPARPGRAQFSEGPESPFKPECCNMGDQKGEKKDAGRGKRKV